MLRRSLARSRCLGYEMRMTLLRRDGPVGFAPRCDGPVPFVEGMVVRALLASLLSFSEHSRGSHHARL